MSDASSDAAPAVDGERRDSHRAVDLLVVGARELATPLGRAERAGQDLGRIEIVEGGAVACDAGRIVAVGPEAELRGSLRAQAELDAQGGTLVPGFVDAHTHPVFDGTREAEFELRVQGATYLEIAAAGGGIASSLIGVRDAGPGAARGGALRATRSLPRTRYDHRRGQERLLFVG